MALKSPKSNMPAGLWRRLWTDLRLLGSLLRDYWSGTYRQVPALSMTALVLTLVYILMPLDLTPDTIPLLGQIDDALLLTGCLFFIEKDLHRYQAWKTRSRGPENG
ncbi:MAG: DUF1232 domain-containing protein [Desulfobacteraceae bacterium]|jgi:uncharacterized membrane protein YkvA (DUF1232 family)|nr:DUF1232 domain-containing protein [Desulfobacteraceae bacterium]